MKIYTLRVVETNKILHTFESQETAELYAAQFAELGTATYIEEGEITP